MSRRKTSATHGKALDLWQAPENAGEPLVCIATTYTFDATFFETECVGRFLQMDGHPSESASVAYLIEREEKLAGARVHALVDRRHARDKESLRWDIIGVLVPNAVQHAKLAVLAWKDNVRVIVGSGNLTEPGYRKNVEVFGTFDLSRAEGGNKAALAATLDFVEEIGEFGVGTVDAASPKGRLRDSIRQVRQHVRSWPALDNRSDPIPVFNSPRQSTIKRLKELWPSGGPAREVGVVSPFFDHPPNDTRAAEALKELLAKRGERYSYFYVKTEDLPDGRIRVFAPRALADSMSQSGGVEVISLLPLQDGEVREVHSKLLSLQNEQWRMLMIGSSNFTSAGLGAVEGKGNCEANLVYAVKLSDPAFKHIDNVWPEYSEKALDLESQSLVWEPSFEEDEDGAGTPPLPAAFEEALFNAGTAPSLRLTLTEKLPSKWSVRVPADLEVLTSERGGAGTHTLPWPADTPPFVLEVTWQAKDGATHVASWPVNVSNPAALPPPEVLRTLSLEELLEILASTRPLPAAVIWVIERRAGKAGIDASLDPLKRLDSQAFLLRRTKRVARALDRLRERLERPALTKEAFEWRLRGVVGPMTLVAAFVKEARLPGEAKFCLAELALTLNRVDPKAPSQGGLAVDVIRGCLTDVIREIEAAAAALESSPVTSLLDSYVTAAFQEATAR